MTATGHIHLLSVLFVTWGLLTMVIGLSTLALGVGTAAFVSTSPEGSRLVAAGLTAAAFIGLALIALGWGLVHVVVGRGLRTYGPRARMAALVLGIVDLLLLPYGTALGIYGLWTLLGEHRRRQFQG